MIKYVIYHATVKVEFASLEAAEAYKVANALTEDILQIDDPTATSAKPKNYPHLSMRQARQAIVLSGLSLQDIDAAIAALPEPNKTLAQIEWEYSSEVHRDNPLVAQVAAVLSVSAEELDDLWDLGLTL